MRERRRILLVAFVLGVALTIGGAALGAATSFDSLYLGGDGVPDAALSFTAPPSSGLPDHDLDGDPGRTIEMGGRGPSESRPGRYQQWEYDVSGSSGAVRGLTIWAAEKGLAGEKRVEFTAYLMLCGSGCDVLDVSTRSLQKRPGWTEVVMNLREPTQTYGPGDRLVVKVIVTDRSDEDMWFAYGTHAFDANLSVMVSSPAGTTTDGIGPTVTTPTGDLAASSTTTSTTPTTEATSTTLAPAVAGDDQGPGGTPAEGTDIDGGPIGNDMFRSNAFDQVRDLRPQEGLMIAYATVSENVELYWQVAVALGALMAVLLLAGFEESESETDDGRRIQWTRRLRRI